MQSKFFLDWKIIAWIILALMFVPCAIIMNIGVIIIMLSDETSILKGLFCVVVALAFSVGVVIILRIYGAQTASILVVSKDKIIWKNPTTKNVKLQIDECKYVGINDCTQLPKVSYAPSSGFFLRRGDELSLIYISNHPMPMEYSHKLSADKCKNGFICFVYSDKLCKALIEVLPEEKTLVLKAFYAKMQEADIRLEKEKQKQKRKELREKEKKSKKTQK